MENLDVEKIRCRFRPLQPTHGAMDDVAEEYAIQEDEHALSGIVVWAKYHGEWIANPFSTRPVVRYLLAEIDELHELLRARP